MDSARKFIGATSQATNARSMGAERRWRSRIFSVGPIYIRLSACKVLIAKEFCVAGKSYVLRHHKTRVEDFDSRPAPADVTYCPKSNFASLGRPTWTIGQTPGR